MTRVESLAIALLVAGVVVSALGVVYVKHVNRRNFSDLQALRAQRDALEVEWNQLLLEQSAWATHPRIEQLAHEQLGMVLPEDRQVVVVRP